MVEEMTDRKIRVLKTIIQEHILTAEPVGSRTLAKKYDFGFSPATIRNEMADLEEMGLLEQPHTSAGRIPTDLGYRFYVDNLKKSELNSPSSIENYLQQLANQYSGIEDVMSGMTRLLANLTHYTAFISEPAFSESKVSRIQLLPVSKKRLLLVVITDNGLVNNKIINLNKDLDDKQLEDINKILNKRLKGVLIDEMDQAFLNNLQHELQRRINYTAEILESLQKEMSNISTKNGMKIHLDGTSYILEQPEFNDVNRLKKVLRILDREEELRKILNNINDELSIKIGTENEVEDMENCSLVLARYHIAKGASGQIGIIGPTRMEYSKVISSVDLAAELLSKLISSTGR
ncbi:MAG: heat-inducible transcriptional repressor HrcA [Bacillota bacterium]